MEPIDLYYLKKSERGSSDQFYDSIEQQDFVHISNARAKIVSIPLFTFGATLLFRSLRDKLFISGNFFFNMMNIKSKYGHRETVAQR